MCQVETKVTGQEFIKKKYRDKIIRQVFLEIETNISAYVFIKKQRWRQRQETGQVFIKNEVMENTT